MIILAIIELFIMLISATLVVPQIFLIKKQIKEEHEEHRRENTTNIMHIWCNSLKKEASMAEEVARKLSKEQCRKLYKQEPFTVSKDIKDNICKFCPLSQTECNKCGMNSKNRLEGKILNELRYHVLCYLNMLETVMTSWHLGIVDKKTIEDQFLFLVTEGKGMALDDFRLAAGGYPLIESFIDAIKDRYQDPKKPL